MIVGDYGGFQLRDDLDAVANPNKRRMTKYTKLNRIFSLFSSLVVNKTRQGFMDGSGSGSDQNCNKTIIRNKRDALNLFKRATTSARI